MPTLTPALEAAIADMLTRADSAGDPVAALGWHHAARITRNGWDTPRKLQQLRQHARFHAESSPVKAHAYREAIATISAHAAYHALGAQPIAWGDALDFHLQRGIVLNTWDYFVMARPVPDDLTPEEELSLADFGLAGHVGGSWHIWAAAGDLAGLASLCARYRIERLRFQRHGTQRIHDIDAETFLHKACELAARRFFRSHGDTEPVRLPRRGKATCSIRP